MLRTGWRKRGRPGWWICTRWMASCICRCGILSSRRVPSRASFHRRLGLMRPMVLMLLHCRCHTRCIAPDAHRSGTEIANATVFECECEGVVGNGIGDATGDVIEDGGESAGAAGVPKVPACANKGRSAKGVIKQRQMLPEDFDLSSSSWVFAQERGVDVVVELQAFKEYHTAKGSTMLDWQAAWRA